MIEAKELVSVIYGDNEVRYRCACGHTTTSIQYAPRLHKAMLKHAAGCEYQEGVTPMKEQERAVQLYDSEMVEHLARRIKKCVPNGDRLTTDEALALAQIAVSTDLNPFVSEVYYIPGKGPHIGIEGLRRKASEQSTYSATVRKMRDEEITEHSLNQGDMGRICEVFRHDTLAKAVAINKEAGEAIIPIVPVIGVGIWRKGDQVPMGKSPAWVAAKRAESDGLKKAFNIVMPIHDDGEWMVVDEGEAEVLRREVALSADRQASNAERAHAPLTARERADALDAQGVALQDVVAAYETGGRTMPSWAWEIRKAVEAHPQASDPVDKGMIQQLNHSAQCKVTEGQFRTFVQIVLTHALEEVTFGEAAILMKAINGREFQARVAELCSPPL